MFGVYVSRFQRPSHNSHLISRFIDICALKYMFAMYIPRQATAKVGTRNNGVKKTMTIILDRIDTTSPFIAE